MDGGERVGSVSERAVEASPGQFPARNSSETRLPDKDQHCGARRFPPLIAPPRDGEGLLSLSNMVEAHVFKALRTEPGVPIREVRKAIEYAEHELGIERLLLRKELMTSGRSVFLEHYGYL